VVAWLIGIAFVSLLVGTFSAYTAAFGSALSPDTLDADPIDTLGRRYATWRRNAEKKARFRLRGAVILTLLAATLLALAVGTATFAPTSNVTSESICLYRGTSLVAQMLSPAQIEALPEGTEIRNC
jgi:hypothetical protein